MSLSAISVSTVCLAVCTVWGEPSPCIITILPLILAIGRTFQDDPAVEEMVEDALMGKRRMLQGISHAADPTRNA